MMLGHDCSICLSEGGRDALSIPEWENCNYYHFLVAVGGNPQVQSSRYISWVKPQAIVLLRMRLCKSLHVLKDLLHFGRSCRWRGSKLYCACWPSKIWWIAQDCLATSAVISPVAGHLPLPCSEPLDTYTSKAVLLLFLAMGVGVAHKDGGLVSAWPCAC